LLEFLDGGLSVKKVGLEELERLNNVNDCQRVDVRMWAEDGRFNVTTWNKWRWFVVVVVVFWLEELTT